MLQTAPIKPQLDPSMTMRLETYLLQLSEVQQRWHDLLIQMQRAAQLREMIELQEMHSKADLIHGEMQELAQRRSEMIQEARESGWRVSSLRAIAEYLPAWNRPRFRSAFNTARNQGDQLRRLHIATWVLLHQTAQHYQDVSLIFMQGSTRRDVYDFGQSSNNDMSGGQLLNEAL
ncbi:MAG: hypothetical protein U0930_10150 [Pirellulales bacterium]